MKINLKRTFKIGFCKKSNSLNICLFFSSAKLLDCYKNNNKKMFGKLIFKRKCAVIKTASKVIASMATEKFNNTLNQPCYDR